MGPGRGRGGGEELGRCGRWRGERDRERDLERDPERQTERLGESGDQRIEPRGSLPRAGICDASSTAATVGQSFIFCSENGQVESRRVSCRTEGPSASTASGRESSRASELLGLCYAARGLADSRRHRHRHRPDTYSFSSSKATPVWHVSNRQPSLFRIRANLHAFACSVLLFNLPAFGLQAFEVPSCLLSSPRFPDVPVTCVANSSFLSQWNSGFWRAVRLRKELTWEDLGRVLVNASSSRLARVPSPPSSSLLHHVFAGLHSFLHPKDVTFSHSLSLSHQPLALAGFHSFDTTSLSFHFCPSPVRFPVHLRSLRPKATRQATSSINQQQPRITAETWLQLCLERFLLLPGDG